MIGKSPNVVRSLAGIAAVSWVALTNVVTRSEPLKRTTDAATKFEPLTASVKASPPRAALVWERLVVVGTGLLTANGVLSAAVRLPSVAVMTTPVSALL